MRSSASFAAFFVLLQLPGCVVEDHTLVIRPDDTTWIQKGQTTRQEVIERFGAPRFTGTLEGEGQYAEYSPPGPGVASLEPRPEGPFPQTYRPPADTMPGAEALGERLWLVYDNQGIVQDFGFGAPPTQANRALH